MDAMRRSHEVYGFITDVSELADDGWYGNPAWASQDRAEKFTDTVTTGVLELVDAVRKARENRRKQQRGRTDDGQGTAGSGRSRALGEGARPRCTARRRRCALQLLQRDEAKRAAFQQEFGVERAASSYEELLADRGVEGVVCHHAQRHAQRRHHPGAEAGKAVYPTSRSRTPSRTRPHRAAVSDTGGSSPSGHSSRRLSGHREMKRWLEDGRIGDISLAEANFSNERVSS
jgi:hypothetical protein